MLDEEKKHRLLEVLQSVLFDDISSSQLLHKIGQSPDENTVSIFVQGSNTFLPYFLWEKNHHNYTIIYLPQIPYTINFNAP